MEETAKPILAVAGDLHLSSHINTQFPEMQGDSVYSFRQIINYCVEHKLDLALAGDICDVRHPGSAEVMTLCRNVEFMRQSGLEVYGIQGQHDMASPSWLEVAGAIPLESNGVELRSGHMLDGLDYRPRAQLLADLAEVRPCDILLLHQMLKGGLPDQAGYDLESDDLPEHVKLVIMGDLHDTYSAPDHKPPIFYTGSTHMRRISETPGKRFLVIRGDLSVESIPLDTRPFRYYRLAIINELNDCLKELSSFDPNNEPKRPGNLSKPYVVIKYNTDLENAYERIATAAGDKFFLRRLPQGPLTEESVDVERMKETNTLETCLDEFVDSGKQPELHTFMLEILVSDDPRSIIEKWKEEIVGT